MNQRSSFARPRRTAAPFRVLGVAALALLAFGGTARAAVDVDGQIRRLTEFVASGYDSARGGFVTREQAPDETAIELAWSLAGTDPAWRKRAERSVEWMWSLYDSVGGGFLHDERDARKDFASFEKRTDSNSRRLENLVDAWRDSQTESGKASGAGARTARYRREVRQVLDFFDRVLLDARGGFVDGQIGDRDLIPESNGHAIHATLQWAAATGEKHWRDFAWKSIDRLWEKQWNEGFGFLRIGSMGEVTAVPQLLDQVEMGRACVLAAHVAGRAKDLERARTIGEVLIERFEDRRQGGMREQVALKKDGTVKNAARESESNARAARFLVELASVTGEQRFREAAGRLVETFVAGRSKPSVDDADWVLAMRGLDGAELPGRPEWKEPESAKDILPPRTMRFGKVRR